MRPLKKNPKRKRRSVIESLILKWTKLRIKKQPWKRRMLHQRKRRRGLEITLMKNLRTAVSVLLLSN